MSRVPDATSSIASADLIAMGYPWSAYAAAVMRLETPDGVVWVKPAPKTQTRGKYPDPDGRAICVVTAHNPQGQTVSEKENARAEGRLERELKRRGWSWWPAAGGDPTWEHVEVSAAVVGVKEREVAALGAEFGQDAIFILTPAIRRVVSCVGNRELSTGWCADYERFTDPSKAATLEEPACLRNPRTAAREFELFVYAATRGSREPQLGLSTLLLRIRR